LLGAVCPREEVEVFVSRGPLAPSGSEQIGDPRWAYMPIHLLAAAEFQPADLFFSGHMQVGASYRTVSYTPKPGGPFAGWVPPGQTLMIKLHLQQPLPGVPGDRRSTCDNIRKCALLSDKLVAMVAEDPLARRPSIVPEFLGVSRCDGGVLYCLVL
jgi:hypothetical protein